MPIHLEFTLTFKDYLQAQDVHARCGAGQLSMGALSGIIFSTAGIITLVLAVTIARNPGSGENAIIVASVGALLLFFPFYYRFRHKSRYRRTLVDDGKYMLDVSDDLIQYESANTKSDIQWNAVQYFSEDKHLFLVYIAPAKFIPVPKRVCSTQQIDELRSLFQRHILPRIN